MRDSRVGVGVVVLALLALVISREWSRRHPRPLPSTRVRPGAPVVVPAGSPMPPSQDTATLTVSGPVSVRRSAEPAPVRDDAAARELLRDGSAGTYIGDIIAQQNGLLMRWPDRRLDALRVWIQPGSDDADFDPRYPVVVEHAFDEWSDAGFPLRFDVIRDSATADVHIVWVAALEAGTSRIGVTRKTRDQYGWIHEAEISIALHDPEGSVLSPALVAGVARHEIGHALGLGHSSNPQDVMYPESRSTTISAADRATMHLLYLLPPGEIR